MAAKTKEKREKSEFCNLYENELGSDVVLLVGETGCQERIPAHSWVLAAGSDWFKALFCHAFAKSGNQEYQFPDDDVNGFNNLIRWLYQNKCVLQSLQSSLDTLHTAIKYLCPDLAVNCVSQITTQLNVKNVLKVIESIQLYSSYCLPKDDSPQRTPSPSAPAWEEEEDCPDPPGVDNVLDPTICCQHLFNECLEIIDKNVVEVMNGEDFIGSNEAFVRMVLKRPTLDVTSEMDVFRALSRWSTAVCKRQHLPLTLDSRRKVLGSLLFQARILTLPLSEIETSKGDLALLFTDEEINYVICCVRSGSTSPTNNGVIPYTLVEHLALLSTPRKLDIPPSKKLIESKRKKKFAFKKRFNKKELILDLVTVLALIFD